MIARVGIASWAQRWDPAASPITQRALIGLLLASAVAGMLGGTWDAAWHVTFLRETFWSPPHLLLYGGTAGSLVVGAIGVGLTVLARRPMPLGYAIVGAGALVVVGAAPLDELWHRAFGRDVDVWSFPHLVALAGGITIGLGSVTVVEADRRKATAAWAPVVTPHASPPPLPSPVKGEEVLPAPSPLPRRAKGGEGEGSGGGWARDLLQFSLALAGHRVVQAVFLAVVLWAAMFGLNWYTLVLAVFRDSAKYPVLVCLTACPVLVLSAGVLGRGGASAVSILYMAYVAAAHQALAALGYALLPFPPMLVVPGLAIDAISSRARGHPGWKHALLAGLAFAPTFYAAEAASLAWYPHPPLEGPPRGPLAMGYHLDVLDRPWDWQHALAALPFAMGVAAASALVGHALVGIEERGLGMGVGWIRDPVRPLSPPIAPRERGSPDCDGADGAS